MVACWRAWQQASSTSDARPSHEGTLGQQDMYPTAEGGTMDPLIPLRYARVFFDGFLTEPRLDHPEGIAIAPDGAIWCGGEAGQLYRISPDGSEIKLMASTGGFILGLAFDEIGRLYACDVAHQTVYRFDPATGDLTPFAGVRCGQTLRTPNWPVVDVQRRRLYVSDSSRMDQAAPGIWAFDLETGRGALWYPKALHFANGMALRADGQALYVAETFARRITCIPICPDGSPGEGELVLTNLPGLPDGLALDEAGNLYIACYEPSRIFRLTPTGELQLLLDDPEAHLLCHPTNLAFRGKEVFIANLGRWHITQVVLDIGGVPLPVRVP